MGEEELYFNLLQICESTAKRNKKGAVKKDEKLLVQNKSLPVAVSMAKAFQSSQMLLLGHQHAQQVHPTPRMRGMSCPEKRGLVVQKP